MSSQEELVIRGLTNAGRKFRPSDWAERLCGVFAAVGPDNRTQYSAHIFPITREGMYCVVVNRKLEDADPMAFRFLMDFARDNDLQVVEGRHAPRS
ncbi:MAG: DUF3579 domain-containing protein [Hydrogenophilaceae bacterium]|nr:DUF3579 domain-containing protein [Hydrogenophilaceae bacterium]